MNNEEKILAMLENLTGKVDGLTNTVEKHGELLAQVQQEQQQMRSDMSQMQATLTRVAVTQENVVIPQIKLLAEGHDTLLNTLARKDRVEALEDDVALLKTVIKSMSQRISELERAQ